MQCINDKAYQEEILRLENVINTHRRMLIAMGMAPHLLDEIEDEAYNKEIEFRD